MRKRVIEFNVKCSPKLVQHIALLFYNTYAVFNIHNMHWTYILYTSEMNKLSLFSFHSTSQYSEKSIYLLCSSSIVFFSSLHCCCFLVIFFFFIFNNRLKHIWNIHMNMKSIIKIAVHRLKISKIYCVCYRALINDIIFIFINIFHMWFWIFAWNEIERERERAHDIMLWENSVEKCTATKH